MYSVVQQVQCDPGYYELLQTPIVWFQLCSERYII